MPRAAVWLLALLCLPACAGGSQPDALRLATTTSTENSGLLDAVLPPFEKRFGIDVQVISVGSGKALKLGENGDVDVILSHAPHLEEAFVAAGDGVNRRSVMYNDFVVVGPPGDPAGLRASAGAADAFRRIAAAKATFLSRGDESGTHQKEKALWKAAGIEPAGDWYLSTGVGMGQLLLMADERRAYTLTDRGTFLAHRRRGDLTILHEGDAMLRNPYTIMAVNPARHPDVRYLAAMQLIAWLTSPEGQRLIGEFHVDGNVLFHPVAGSGRDSGPR
jgi:tungstate transport system substrate-binding protein